ncbi:dihydrolipoamide acetyltransferase family protein [Vagococcus zengguangii]|uniref:Dihydrolipoamide acetyltransferase component of pyruvate dehydrogenase complex n=1 Tax=Vagococcus zengguangii TaxID=2571750 RepID=A0A4D7CR75_9ENTE|nr:dihydrolipoamide acetyltransferase family protein [Vagococcus zengguangii]QCI86665.1 2-oxo acid dehydrogenase subunit E2 [Vagococcus zengguangii]TLG78285.1 2-oxo acid dehydrogenase subunit E2 [Vagococcus zengguangii]
MALENILMPKLGESVTEGAISSWLVQPGQHVEKYDALAEVLTDKVLAEIPSSFAGTIKEILVVEDDVVPIGTVVCTIETEDEGSVEGDSTVDSEPTAPTPSVSKKVTSPSKAPVKQSETGARFSPAVLKLAGEHNIDLAQVSGSGAGGRITRKDLLKLIENGQVPTTGAAVAEENHIVVPPVAESATVKIETVPQSVPSVNMGGSVVEIPVSGVRKAIAKHMVESKQTIPHAWMMTEVDATNLVNYRNELKNKFKKEEGYNLTYFAFFVKAVAQTLKNFPMLNSSWAGDKIIQNKDINISIAIAANDVLFVPVIKHADEKSIKGIAREINELAIKAKKGKLTAADMEGGTFTVNSTGSFGSIQSMGIINHPQAAILQVEAIVKRPVVVNEMIGIRDMVNLCLSIDHRVLDGMMAGAFLKQVKETVERMTEETTSIY